MAPVLRILASLASSPPATSPARPMSATTLGPTLTPA
jgi:hypothetical protein